MKCPAPRRPRSGFTLVELLVVISIIVLLATLLVPHLASSREEANKLQCKVNLRNLHLACVLYVEDEHLFPGGGEGSQPGLDGIRQLIKGGYLPQMKAVICPSSVDGLKPLEASLRGGSIKSGQEETVAQALTYSQGSGGPVGTCSYFFTGRTITSSQGAGYPLCVDANHHAADVIASQFNGAAAEADGHAAGFHVLTNDGAIDFIKLQKTADAAKITTTKGEMNK